MASEAGARVAQGELTTLDCVAQSLAVGPIFSAGLLGGALAALSGGVGPLVIVITLIGILAIGRVVSEFAKRYCGSGTVYEFVARSLGKRCAVFATGLYYCVGLSITGASAVLGGLLIRDVFVQYIGVDLPWWLWALGVIAVTAAVNMIGLQVSVRTQLILMTVSALPFVILFVKVVLAGGTDGNSLLPFDPTHMAAGGSIFKGVVFAILMFAGFELSAALGEETKEPKRSIPLAVLLTIFICAVFFIMTQYTLAIGTHQPGQGFAVLSRSYLPPVFAIWIDLAIILDLIASAIGFQLACARGLFTFARDGVLPGSLARLNARQIPMAGNAVMTALSLAVVLLALAVYGTGFVDAHAAGSFANAKAFRGFLGLAVDAGLLFSFVYMLMCFGVLRTFGRRRPIDAAASVAGIGTCLLAILAQFVEGAGPEPDYQWGRTLSVATILLAALWAALLKKDAVERVAQYTIEHVIERG